jgi:predicted nucleic acid-binding protein
MAVLDTNVIVRYLTQDHAEHARRAYDLLKEVEAGNRSVFLPEGVLVEVVQVLSSRQLYQVDRQTIRQRLRPIILLPLVQLPNKRAYLNALDVYVDYPRLSFVDSICVAQAQRHQDKTVISFDEGFRNVPGLNWERP